MRLRTVPRRTVCKTLAGSVVLLSFPVVAYGLQISLRPDPLTECETLTVQWQADSPATVAIVDEGQEPAQTLFHATVDAPTGALEWVINATGGAQLDIAVSTAVAGIGIGMSLQRVVQPGTPTCFSSDPRPSESSPGRLPSTSAPGQSETDTPIPSSTHPPSVTARSSSQPTAPVTSLSLSPVPPTPSLDSTTSPQVVAASRESSSSLSTTVLLPARPSRRSLSSGAGAGIAIGVGVVAVCLALVLCSYVRRHRSRASTTLPEPFPSYRRSRTPTLHEGVSSASRRVDYNDDKSKSNVLDKTRMRSDSDSLLAARASSLDARPLHRVVDLSRARQESVDGLVVSEKRLWESRGRTLPTSTSESVPGVEAGGRAGVTSEVSAFTLGAERHQVAEPSTDGGVRRASGRVEEVVDDFDGNSASGGSTLPPPYSLHFGDKMLNG